ncbi:MAG: hypothetical protein EBT78_15055 [Betaproteobacteria bacterium]|nr:hypothetical protein [Betaproteobacteria bacterium]
MPQKIGMVFIERQAKQVQAQRVQAPAKQAQVQAPTQQVQQRPAYAKMGIFQPHSIIHTPPGSCGSCGH